MLLQIDTYGRETREIPGKKSQTIQLDRQGASHLRRSRRLGHFLRRLPHPVPKAPVAEAKQPSVAAMPAVKPVPKKVMRAPTRPVPPVQAKTAAANGKLVVKKSKKEAR